MIWAKCLIISAYHYSSSSSFLGVAAINNCIIRTSKSSKMPVIYITRRTMLFCPATVSCQVDHGQANRPLLLCIMSFSASNWLNRSSSRLNFCDNAFSSDVAEFSGGFCDSVVFEETDIALKQGMLLQPFDKHRVGSSTSTTWGGCGVSTKLGSRASRDLESCSLKLGQLRW